MIILRRFLDRKKDMESLAAVLARSLAIASREGSEHAGAQHLLLAALEMEEGSANRAFGRLGATRQGFVEAIAAQHAAALPGLPEPNSDSTTPTNPKPDATYDAAVKATHDFHNAKENGGRFSGAYLTAGVASIQHGVAARALQAMDIDIDQLIGAALQEARPSR